MKDYTKIDSLYDRQVELRKQRVKLDYAIKVLETEIMMEEIELGIEKLPF